MQKNGYNHYKTKINPVYRTKSQRASRSTKTPTRGALFAANLLKSCKYCFNRSKVRGHSSYSSNCTFVQNTANLK